MTIVDLLCLVRERCHDIPFMRYFYDKSRCIVPTSHDDRAYAAPQESTPLTLAAVAELSTFHKERRVIYYPHAPSNVFYGAKSHRHSGCNSEKACIKLDQRLMPRRTISAETGLRYIFQVSRTHSYPASIHESSMERIWDGARCGHTREISHCLHCDWHRMLPCEV